MFVFVFVFVVCIWAVKVGMEGKKVQVFNLYPF